MTSWMVTTAALIADVVMAGGSIGDFGVAPHIERKFIKKIARENNIDVWGIMYTHSMDCLMFTVRKSDAKDMYNALRDAGCSTMYRPKVVG